MKPCKKHFLLTALFLLTLLCEVCPAAEDANACGQWIARIVSIEGNVQVRTVDDGEWHPANVNDFLSVNVMIRVAEFSRAALALCNESVLRLDANTTLTLTDLEEENTALLDLVEGAVHFFSRQAKSLKFFTPFVNGAIEGTEFVVEVSQRQTLVTLFQGRVMAYNDQGSIDLSSGQASVAEEGRAPVYQTVLKPRDAVQWAVYYPALIEAEPDSWSRHVGSRWQETTHQAAKHYRAGDLPGALSLMMQVPADGGDATFFANRAAMLLSVGRVDAARADIRQVLLSAPSNGTGLALESIDALVGNEREKALEIAVRAVDADPDSIPAKIALSYAQQANLDLKSACTSLVVAVEADPQHALAWARLAELRQMIGDLDGALAAAQRAAEIRPDLSLVQTVLGFSHLTRIELDAAKKAFDTAITQDQGNPMPRLGLGLTQIRQGYLAAGRSDIEIAASLDPNNSLIRSYLGKAYYEEKRDKLAANQLETAKQLDPNDPTPWFYDAIRKQTINRPVEALHDLQKSIELNDNRAVYRSRLLLDEDLAARSAGLGRIFSDLGFQQLALVEGWKSVNTDPSNFSAHRFLADSYSALPRHEVARVSELLQSQLLQPINITPLQPRLAETNLPLISGQGPESLSFNTYNPLFSRNQLVVQAGGLIGEEDTWGAEGVVSGIYNKLSISAAYSHSETDGFRKNGDFKDDLTDVFAQASLSPATSIQAEYRHKEENSGDITRRFDPDDFSTSLRNDEESTFYRAGLRHAFQPNSDLLLSFIYKDADDKEHRMLPVPPPVSISSELKASVEGYTAEAQYQYRHHRFNVITGLGYFDADRKDHSVDTLSIPIPDPPYVIKKVIPNVVRTDIHHTNLYLYSQVNFPENVAWTLGASGDFFDGGLLDLDRDQFNPKFGLTWEAFENTTVRAAAFRTFKRSLVSDQTVEPTQVAGFNQFFDDTEGTEAWRYGAAVDQKFSRNFFGGVELSQRDLEVPYFEYQLNESKQADWTEKLARVYFFWAPHNWISLSAEYHYEWLKRDADAIGVEQFTKLKTHRVPLAVNFFHPSGVSAKLMASYVDQSGTFADPNTGVRTDDGDCFWVVDASLSYRLPKRWGIVSLEARNLLNESFNFLDMDPSNAAFYPERMVLAKMTLTF